MKSQGAAICGGWLRYPHGARIACGVSQGGRGPTRVDTLINSAAIYPRRPTLGVTDEEWDLSNVINIKGTYHMMVAAIEQMKTQEPRDHVRYRIVNITSVDAFSPSQEHPLCRDQGCRGQSQ